MHNFRQSMLIFFGQSQKKEKCCMDKMVNILFALSIQAYMTVIIDKTFEIGKSFLNGLQENVKLNTFIIEKRK